MLRAGGRCGRPLALHSRPWSSAAAPQAADAVSKGNDLSAIDDAAIMRAALSSFQPEELRPDDVKRVRLADLPSTTRLMESFIPGDATPSVPLYDLPTYLERTTPAHDLSPKSPFYHWTSWLSEHVSPAQQRRLLAFDQYMRSEQSRTTVLRKAQYELAQLWDWQHRRVAAGLPAAPEASAAAGSSSSKPAASGSGSEAASGASTSSSQEPAAPSAAPAASTSRPSTAAPAGMSILAAMSRAEHRQQHEKEEAIARYKKAGLSRSQVEFLTRLEDPSAVFSLADKLRHRFDTGSRLLNFPSRLRDTLRTELELRSAQEGASSSGARGAEAPAASSSKPAAPLGAQALKQQAAAARTALAALAEKDAKQQAADSASASSSSGTPASSLHWSHLQALNHKANMAAVLKQHRRNARKAEDDGVLRLAYPAYQLDLSTPPPTTTLDLLCDYLEIKYQDILVQKAAATKMMETAGLPGGAPSAPELSAAEVEAINAQLQELFDGGRWEEYGDALSALMEAGLVGREEAEQLREAARLAASSAGAGSEGAVSASGLLGLLQGTGKANAAAAEARAAWSSAGEAFTAWAAGMKAEAQQEIARLRAAGASISPEQEAALLSVWSSAPSYSAAEATWGEYLRKADVVAGPALSSVLAAAQAGDARINAELEAVHTKFSSAAGATAAGASTLDVSSPASLQAAFQVTSALPAALREKWAQVSQQFGLQGTAAPEDWEGLWKVMHAAQQQIASQGAEPAAAAAPAAVAQAPAKASSAGVHMSELSPAYPGARPIVRFQQTLVLGASSGFSANPDAQQSGFTSHPASAAVVLRVHARELAREAGLSEEALQHVLRVAGPSRFDERTGDIVLKTSQYACREENRKLLLEQLHAILQDSMQRQQQVATA